MEDTEGEEGAARRTASKPDAGSSVFCDGPSDDVDGGTTPARLVGGPVFGSGGVAESISR
jgi:hypothetical protein